MKKMVRATQNRGYSKPSLEIYTLNVDIVRTSDIPKADAFDDGWDG